MNKIIELINSVLNQSQPRKENNFAENPLKSNEFQKIEQSIGKLKQISPYEKKRSIRNNYTGIIRISFGIKFEYLKNRIKLLTNLILLYFHFDNNFLMTFIINYFICKFILNNIEKVSLIYCINDITMKEYCREK